MANPKNEIRTNDATSGARTVDMKLEVVAIPDSEGLADYGKAAGRTIAQHGEEAIIRTTESEVLELIGAGDERDPRHLPRGGLDSLTAACRTTIIDLIRRATN